VSEVDLEDAQVVARDDRKSRLAAVRVDSQAGAAERRALSARLREYAKTEAQKIGVAQLARRLGTDPSNLRKAINGAREFGSDLHRAMRRYCGGDG
jgi:hypothetical protein